MFIRDRVQKDFPAGVREVVLSGRLSGKGKLFYTAADRRIAQENMDIMKINSIKNKSFNELSGGQQQRVSIGRALLNSPALLLADEPTGNLDSENSKEIIKLLRQFNKENKQTVIIITHDERIALSADRVIEINDGKILRDEVR